MKWEMELSLVLFCMLPSTSGPKDTRAGPSISYASIDTAYANHFSRYGSRGLGKKGGGRGQRAEGDSRRDTWSSLPRETRNTCVCVWKKQRIASSTPPTDWVAQEGKGRSNTEKEGHGKGMQGTRRMCFAKVVRWDKANLIPGMGKCNDNDHDNDIYVSPFLGAS